MSTSYVNAAGLRLRVARTGEGRPLLLITGIGAQPRHVGAVRSGSSPTAS